MTVSRYDSVGDGGEAARPKLTTLRTPVPSHDQSPGLTARVTASLEGDFWVLHIRYRPLGDEEHEQYVVARASALDLASNVAVQCVAHAESVASTEVAVHLTVELRDSDEEGAP